MTQDTLLVDDVDGLAANWFSRMRSGTLTESDEAALEAWLDHDPANRSAYDAVERTWTALELVRMHPRVLAMRDALPEQRPFRLERYFPPQAIAACVVAAVVGVLGVVAWPSMRPKAPPPVVAGLLQPHLYQTGEGQRSVVTLADGTEVMLHEGARLRTLAERGRRVVRLESGRAYFRVAKDKNHPFVVQAGGRTVTALGTAFEVSVEKQAFAITLVEGRVRVQTPVAAAPSLGARPNGLVPPSIETTEMVAGSQLAGDINGWRVTRTDVSQETSWTRDQLIFEAQPLAVVAEQMNRRSPRKIIIADEDVGHTLISGNFRPGDVDGFARALAAYDYAAVAHRGDGAIELSAP